MLLGYAVPISVAVTVPATVDRRVLASLAYVAALVAVYSFRTADADLWGHLTYGRLFLENGGQIVADPFAYTTEGRQWSTHEYLAQMALAQAYIWLGPSGLIGLKCVLGALAVLCLYGCLRTVSNDPRIWAPLLMLTSQSLCRWCQFRPQLFTYVLFAYFVLTLFRYLLVRSRQIWVLPLLIPLWVNLHGGFLAGIGAVGLALVGHVLQAYNRLASLEWQKAKGKRQKALSFFLLPFTFCLSSEARRAFWPLALVLLGCFAGSLLNPLGWRLWPYLATEFGHKDNGKYLQEWQPVSIQEQPWTASLLGLLLVLLLLLTVLAQLKTNRIADLAPWQWLLSCVPLAVMALQSQRHIPILTIWATPVLALLAQAAATGWEGRPLWERTWLSTSGLIAIATVLMFYAVLSDPRPRISTAGALCKTDPHGVVTVLRANKCRGNLYTPLWWGSYFTWELSGRVKVSMDGRNVTLFAPEDVTDNLKFYLEPDADLKIPFKKDPVLPDYLVVPADSPALPRVQEDERWLLVYEDDQASLFQTRSSERSGK